MNQPHSQHESNVQADTRVDNYALDDTLAGRITQSAAAGLMLSFPDWIKNKTALSITYVFSFIGFGALVAITNAQREDEEPQAEQPPVEQSQAEQNDSDLKQWAVFAAVILLLCWAVLLTSRFPRQWSSACASEVFPNHGLHGAQLLLLSYSS